MKNPWKTLGSKIYYDNPWIKVVQHKVINPSGKPGIYGTVHFKNVAVGIIPVDANGFTWLVGQYRYPLKRYSWEIPEGGGSLKVSPLATAKRELKEETGLSARKYQKIITMHLSNSVTDEFAVVYLATQLSQGKSAPEEDEKLRIRKIELQKAYEMVLSGEITDSMSVAGLLRAQSLLTAG